MFGLVLKKKCMQIKKRGVGSQQKGRMNWVCGETETDSAAFLACVGVSNTCRFLKQLRDQLAILSAL